MQVADLRREEQARGRRGLPPAASARSSSRRSPTSTSLRARAPPRRTRWTSTTCSSARSTCSSCSRRCASATRAPSAGSSSTSTRTPTTPSTAGCSCWLGEHRNLTVVGDDDQSIYGFRGADINNILDFEDDFPGRARRQAGAELPLDADDPDRRQRGRREQPRAQAQAAVDRDRARATRSRCASSTTSTPRRATSPPRSSGSSDEGVSRGEIAVFYRTNAQSRVLEDMLVRAQIGYQVIGGTKFYERAEIKDALAYLTFLVNPQRRGRVHARSSNSPKRGIGQTSLSRVLAHADTMGEPVWEVAAAPEDVPGARHRRAEGARALHVDDGAAARARRGRRAGRRRCSRSMLRETGYLEALEAERTIEAQGRIENLEELVRRRARVRRQLGRGRGRRRGRVPAADRAALRRRTRCATTRAS